MTQRRIYRGRHQEGDLLSGKTQSWASAADPPFPSHLAGQQAATGTVVEAALRVVSNVIRESDAPVVDGGGVRVVDGRPGGSGVCAGVDLVDVLLLGEEANLRGRR